MDFLSSLKLALITTTLCWTYVYPFPEEPTEDTTTFELMRSYLHGHRGQKLVGGKPLMNRGRLTLADRTLKLRKSFERALVVDCTNKKSIAIKLDLNHPSLTETERTLMQSAFISSPKATCHSGEFNGFGDFLRFSLPSTKDCGIDYWETNETFTFSNTIRISYNLSSESPIKRTEMQEDFELKCVFAKYNLTPILSQTLNLYADSKEPTPMRIPDKIQLGKAVFLQGLVSANSYFMSEIHSFPVNCWTTPTATNAEKKYFLQEGCPKSDHQKRKLATVYHFDQSPNRVGFHLGNYSLFSSHATVFITCQLLVCVKSTTTVINGLPRCPDSRFCSYQSPNKHRLPERLATIALDTLTVGPISVYQKEIDTVVQQRSSVLCSRSCPLTSVRTSEPIVIIGVGTPMVVTIAFSSFLLGLVIMGLLWLIHSRTDPAKKIALAKTKSKNLSSTGDKVQFSENGHLSTKLILNC